MCAERNVTMYLYNKQTTHDTYISKRNTLEFFFTFESDNSTTASANVSPYPTEISLHLRQQMELESAKAANIAVYVVLATIPAIMLIAVVVGKYARRLVYRRRKTVAKNRMTTILDNLPEGVTPTYIGHNGPEAKLFDRRPSVLVYVVEHKSSNEDEDNSENDKGKWYKPWPQFSPNKQSNTTGGIDQLDVPEWKSPMDPDNVLPTPMSRPSTADIHSTHSLQHVRRPSYSPYQTYNAFRY